MTDPTLKPTPGPSAVRPYQPGETPGPGSVFGWFADVKLSGSNVIVRDCIIAVQARRWIGQRGSPVLVYKDPLGNYMIVGRSDRLSDFQSVQSFTTIELGLGFLRGLRQSGSEWVSAFFPYTQSPAAVVTATHGGIQQRGLNRGVPAFTTGGAPVTSYRVQQFYEPGSFHELDFGVDSFGFLFLVTVGPTGTTRVKVP